jgi:hypothetical protein
MEANLTQQMLCSAGFAKPQRKVGALRLGRCVAAVEADADEKGQCTGLAVTTGHIDGFSGSVQPDSDFMLRGRLFEKESLRQGISAEHNLLHHLPHAFLH